MARKGTASDRTVKEEPIDSLTVEPSNTQIVRSQDGGVESESGHDENEEEEEEEEEFESEQGSQKLWDAEIIDEKPTHYLFKWKDLDDNGKLFKPSWEPKENATEDVITEWVKIGRRKWTAFRAAEKRAEMAKRRQGKPPKLTEKQKEKLEAEVVMNMKLESPDPEPLPERSRRSREISTIDSPAPRSRPVKRRLAVPDSENSSPAPSEPQQLKKQKADSRPTKKVNFIVGTGRRNPSTSIPPTSAGASQAIDKGKRVELVMTRKEEEEEPLAPAASSNESTTSIIPDSQPAPSKAFDYASIDTGSQMVEESLQNSQIASQSNAIAGPSQPPPPRSFPMMNSPATTHSELGSDHGQDDDGHIFNDISQPDKDEEEEEVQVEQHETLYYSPARPVHASTSRQMNRVPVPPVSAFFPSEPKSSQFDPIEDPDSSPFRSRQQFTHHHSSPFAGSPSLFDYPQPRKGRIELQMGPSEEDDIEMPSQGSVAFEAERMASAVSSYVSDLTPLDSRPSQTIKRQASRPLVTPIAFEIESGGGGAVNTAAVSVPHPVFPDDDGSDSELDLDDLSPGGINEAYFTSDLLPTAQPLNFDDVVDYEGGSQVVAGAPSEAVDAGEGGNSNGGAESSRGGYPYSAYPSNYSQQQQQQQQTNQSQASPIPGFITSGSSSSYAGNGYGGGSASGNGGGGGGGYPYPSHLQPPSAHAQSSKREYEEDREESAKRARRDQEERQYRQQQQQYYQQQQQQHATQQYPQQAYSYPQSENRPNPPPPPQQHYSQAPPPPPQSNHHQQQYARLPPMQTAPPQQSYADYSRSSSQLPPIQHAIYNTGYPHNPSPHPQPIAPSVSVAAASPPPAASPVSASTAGPALNRLTSPSIARVQSVEGYRDQPSTSANRTPSPLTSLQPLPPQERISSPAPDLDGVNTLIELVRDSPHIEANDGTKEEITRFLRDPTSYRDRPLARSDLWAFELRRQILDGGEKVDFIILYTREGKFQLKRGPPHEIKFEFARSLVHAPVRVRGSTPAVDAMPTLQSSATASLSTGPLALSSMTRDQLEAEVNALRSRLTTAETELAALSTLSAENATLKTEVQTLTQSNKSLKNSRDSAQQDMSYIQEQYSIASSAAMARAQEAEIAETESARLQGLLSEGLKQKDLFYKSEVARWKLEVQRMKKEVEFTRAERRKLDERGIREKAGKWDEVVARRKVKADRKEESWLRVEAGGTVDEEEEEDLDSEEEIVSKILLSERKQSPTPPSSTTSIVKLVPGDFSVSTNPTQSQSSAVEGGFRCEWRSETQPDSSALPTSCGLVLPTREALMEHCIGHIPLS